MLFEVEDIFAEEAGGVGETGEGAAKAAASSPAKTVGAQYKELWLRYRKGLHTWADEQRAILMVERNLVPRDFGKYMCAFEDNSANTVERLLEMRATEIRKTLIWIAEKHFAPEGVTLKVDGYEIFERFPSERDSIDEFDPDAIWNYLEKKYGGDGAKLAWQQVAKAFTANFNLDTNEAIVVKGGYVAIEKRVWINGLSKKFSDKNRLEYDCCELLFNALNVLSEIAKWSERHILSSDLKLLAKKFNERDYEVQSREKFMAGSEIVIITYISRFEFRIRQDFAEEIQVFLGTFLEVES